MASRRCFTGSGRGSEGKMREPIEALTKLYAPAFFLRIGLRYRDRIDREKLGLQSVPWRELLRPEALGELGDDRIEPHVAHILRELLVRLSEDAGHVRVVHGLQRDGERLTYIIDSDFFTDKQTDTKAVGNALDAFNRRAGHLFRWYISTRLHDAMDPRDPPAA
jgi:uncharacterized protein (TIGR04255 family)